MDERGSYSEESGIDRQQALSQKPGGVNVSAPTVRGVQNNRISNTAQAKEDKAKAIAATEANRKAKLAAEKPLHPAQQSKPIAQASHPISKGLVKAVPVQTASTADWSESSSDGEPPPKATGRTTSSGGHPFVSINNSSRKSR